MNSHENVFAKGPSSEAKPTPESVRLTSGDPLYYVLLKDAGASGVISAHDSNEAHDKLRTLFAADPEKVLSCEGKSTEEALEILNSIAPGEEIREAA
ncbi:MAG: hypothetical protein JWN64_592 [Parcubacteria group bacterium]|nr:hypothetical protein [Parcubacteria group bacterium]